MIALRKGVSLKEEITFCLALLRCDFPAIKKKTQLVKSDADKVFA